jgi:hypothetical protein
MEPFDVSQLCQRLNTPEQKEVIPPKIIFPFPDKQTHEKM